MTFNKKHPDEYKAHVIILPSNAPVAICLTRSMAFELATLCYGDLEKREVIIRVANDMDWELIR